MEGSKDWASLPWLILEPVAGHLTDAKDFVSIRAACPKWRDDIRLNAHGLFQPWIMTMEGPQDYSGRVRFHSMSSGESHMIQPTALQGKMVAGSGAGLLIGIDQHDDLLGVLVNPLTGESTALPRLPDCFRGGVTGGFVTEHKVNDGVVDVIVVVWVWAPGLGPTVALWRRGCDGGWATTHDADPERFWAFLPRHLNRLVTHGPQVLAAELAAVAAAAVNDDHASGGTPFFPGGKGSYLIEHEGKVRFLFEFYAYNPEMPAGPTVTFALKDKAGNDGAIVNWADAPELRDKAILQSVDGAVYVIPASDGLGLSKNAVYYFEWRYLEDDDEQEDGGGGGGRSSVSAFCLCKLDMLEGVDTIVKQFPNPDPWAWATTRWFVPSFKF